MPRPQKIGYLSNLLITNGFWRVDFTTYPVTADFCVSIVSHAKQKQDSRAQLLWSTRSLPGIYAGPTERPTLSVNQLSASCRRSSALIVELDVTIEISDPLCHEIKLPPSPGLVGQNEHHHADREDPR